MGQNRSSTHFSSTDSTIALSGGCRVERFFRDLTVKRIRRGVFHNVAELQQAIREYIDEHNRKPTPYLWTAKAKGILEKVKRAWMKLRADGFVPKSQKFAALGSIDHRLAAEGSSA